MYINVKKRDFRTCVDKEVVFQADELQGWEIANSSFSELILCRFLNVYLDEKRLKLEVTLNFDTKELLLLGHHGCKATAIDFGIPSDMISAANLGRLLFYLNSLKICYGFGGVPKSTEIADTSSRKYFLSSLRFKDGSGDPVEKVFSNGCCLLMQGDCQCCPRCRSVKVNFEKRMA